MSLYGDYIRERLNDGIIENANGFATYRFIDSNGVPAVYIVDIYVVPDARKSKLASEMADEIVKIGLHNGCRQLIGTVCPSAKGATDSLKVLLAYGMSLFSADKDVIIFKKEI